MTEEPGREVHPQTRYDWESVMRRARLGGLIAGSGVISDRTGRPTRGAVSGAAFKAVAMVWASHADPDGTNIYPGDATLAMEAEVGLDIAKAVKLKMVELGLTILDGRHGRNNRYRLTLPSDLLDVVVVLDPERLRSDAQDLKRRRRGVRKPSDRHSRGTPPDTPDDG